MTFKITLRKTSDAEVHFFGAKGRRVRQPADYDIYFGSERIGKLWGCTSSRIGDSGGHHNGEVFGVQLVNAAYSGEERQRMNEEIYELIKNQYARFME